ncbi:MAG: transaldolase [Thermomicrobiales bacterium]
MTASHHINPQSDSHDPVAQSPMEDMMDARIAQLHEQGQSVWQDDISRDMIRSGEIQRIIDTGIRGLTSNPSIFEKAIATGSAYDEDVRTMARQGKDASTIFEAVAVEDIRNTCDLFLPLYRSSGGADGFVSIEVSPGAARDAERTRREALALWKAVDRPNVMIKIPGTVEGAPVIADMIAEGLNNNVTLLFSLEAYERVALAFIEGLERRAAAGKPVSGIASVASFFVSRVDALVDKLLDQKIEATGNQSLAELKGKAAVANAKLAYERFQEIFNSPRFAKLAAAGAEVQRPLWASTSVKNPAYRDVMYVEELVGPHTVNTMPRPTIQAFIDHGVSARTVDKDLGESHAIMAALAAAGIDMDAVTTQLEEEGINSFIKSFDTLLAGVESKRAQFAAS